MSGGYLLGWICKVPLLSLVFFPFVFHLFLFFSFGSFPGMNFFASLVFFAPWKDQYIFQLFVCIVRDISSFCHFILMITMMAK